MTGLVRRFVDEVLNGHRDAVVSEIFAPTFRDHDPIFQAVDAQSRLLVGGVQEMREMLKFLSRPGVDLVFHLEDCFGHEDRAAYRLFGEGTLPTGALRATDANASLLGGDVEGVPSVHATYASCGIFRASGAFLCERWGNVVVEWS